MKGHAAILDSAHNAWYCISLAVCSCQRANILITISEIWDIYKCWYDLRCFFLLTEQPTFLRPKSFLLWQDECLWDVIFLIGGQEQPPYIGLCLDITQLQWRGGTWHATRCKKSKDFYSKCDNEGRAEHVPLVSEICHHIWMNSLLFWFNDIPSCSKRCHRSGSITLSFNALHEVITVSSMV